MVDGVLIIEFTFTALGAAASDLLNLFSEIAKATKAVKAELYRLLVDEFKYFE